MPLKTDKLIQRFLDKFNSVEVQEAFDLLKLTVEKLENKNDPEPEEISFVSTAYQLIEAVEMTKGELKKYKVNQFKQLDGNKLNSLYKAGEKFSIFD